MSIGRDILILMLSQAVFFTILFFLLKVKFKSGTGFTALCAVVSFPMTFILAYFLGGFDKNICYSNSISLLASSSKMVIESDDPKVKDSYLSAINNLPTRGYETECKEMMDFNLNLNTGIKGKALN